MDALGQLVEDLLELSRIESGQVPFRLEPVPLSEAVLPAVERLRPQAERAGLRLECHLEADLVWADRERIQQVVTNLVHNAIKFTPAGGRLSVSASRQGEDAVVSVADTGVGLSSEDLSRIFERFYKADQARRVGNPTMSTALDQPIATLPHTIFVYAVSPYEDWRTKAWATALVLILLVLLLNVSARLMAAWRTRRLGSVTRV